MSFEAPIDESAPPRSSLLTFVLRLLAVAALVGIVGYFALGMPGMDHGAAGSMSGADDMEGMDMSGAARSPEALPPEAFRRAIQSEEAFVVNVHRPATEMLAGTDAFVPFDSIDAAALPADKSTTILLYCETGRMSEEAGIELSYLGYTQVSHLEGGLDAWQAAGFDVQPRRQ